MPEITIVDAPATLAATELAELAATLQTRPDRFNAYFGETTDEIAAEIEEVDDWREHTVVAHVDGRLVGWLLAETDDEIGRVWWWGPVVADGVDWLDAAERLFSAAGERLRPGIEQHEFAADARFTLLGDLARRHGAEPATGSVLLHRSTTPSCSRRRIDGLTISTPEPATAVDVVALHDRLFAGAHLTGQQLVRQSDDILLTAMLDGALVGYVRAEIQPGGEGYLDFLGVDEFTRGRGVGGELVAVAVDELAERGATTVSLTVREDNTSARHLYDRLRFDGSRILVPYRRGFALA